MHIRIIKSVEDIISDNIKHSYKKDIAYVESNDELLLQAFMFMHLCM
jgi:hypothetical protein